MAAASCVHGVIVAVPSQSSSSSSSSRRSGRSSLGGFCSRGFEQDLGRKELVGKVLRLERADCAAWVSSGFVVEAARRVDSGRSYVLSSTLHIAEGNEEQVTALCKGILEWAQVRKLDRSSGIQLFECNVDTFEKNVLHFWERYDSFQTMNDTRASPEHTKFMEEVRPFLTGPIGLAVYEYKGGKIGHMMNPIGPKGEGGLDDATGQAGTKQQSASIGQGLGSLEEDEDVKSWGLDKLLSKVRGEDKGGGWSFKTLFGDAKK